MLLAEGLDAGPVAHQDHLGDALGGRPGRGLDGVGVLAGRDGDPAGRGALQLRDELVQVANGFHGFDSFVVQTRMVSSAGW